MEKKIYYVQPRVAKTVMSLLDIVLGRTPEEPDYIPPNSTTTRRRSFNENERDENWATVGNVISKLIQFNADTERFRSVPRQSLYNTFFIPKRNGKMRQIDAPVDDFKKALDRLKSIFEESIGDYMHHTCAFAYVRKRCTVDVAKVHQACKSNWFAHFDFSGFFPSTTLPFVMNMLSRISPFNLIIEHEIGRVELEQALELCFLNGGLPQGTPMSPWLTNVMMIPIDAELFKRCGHNSPHLIYTRYADDLVISSYYDFDAKKVEDMVVEVLNKFNAPFRLNREKTHYNSRAGSNWILGVMLNKDNQITIGWENSKLLKAMLTNYIGAVKAGKPWDIEEVYQFQGKIAYWRMIEPDDVNATIKHFSDKFHLNVEETIKKQLRGEPIT